MTAFMDIPWCLYGLRIKDGPNFLFVGDLSASDTSLVDLVERHRGPLPQELMPLPSSDRDNQLEWTHLVDVASTFESERNTHYGMSKI